MKKFIGFVSVDSGSVWVGDPCYVIPSEAADSVESWSDYCDALDKINHWTSGKSFCQPLGQGIGLHVQTRYGDGSYPVFAEVNSDGSISNVTIDFDDEPSDVY